MARKVGNIEVKNIRFTADRIYRDKLLDENISIKHLLSEGFYLLDTAVEGAGT